MGRWTLAEDFGKVVNTGITDIHCDSNSSAEVAKMLHNTDCDAYEARIAELEADKNHLRLERDAERATCRRILAELARVKAESLRVVKCGRAGERGELEPSMFVFDGKLWVWHEDEWRSPHDYDAEMPYDPSLTVQPVRLERWETAE